MSALRIWQQYLWILGKDGANDIFHIIDSSLYIAGHDSRTNLFQEGGDDVNQGVSAKDLMHMPHGPITRARAGKMKEATAMTMLVRNILEQASLEHVGLEDAKQPIINLIWALGDADAN